MNTTTLLDAEDYLHLALHAAASGNHHACMMHLKEALVLQPSNARAIYLFAVQHAELGLLDRAIQGMDAALAIEPALEIARFQLGLLLLKKRRSAQAVEQFTALVGSADEALSAYSQAMLALGRDDMKTARDQLASGLSRPSGNRGLSVLMQRLLDQLSVEHGSTKEPAVPGTEIALGAYGKGSL